MVRSVSTRIASSGYLPEALRNYLLRLGWSHGDDEIISTEQAIEWFDIDAVGRAPARFDFAKLDNLNGHYIRAAEDERLVALVAPRLEKLVGKPLTDIELGRLREAMPELKLRPKTLVELAANARFLVAPRPIRLDDKAAKLLNSRRAAATGRFDRPPARPGMAARAARGRDPRLCRSERNQTRLGCPAVARRSDRFARFAGDLCRDEDPGARGEPRTDRGCGRIGGLTRTFAKCARQAYFCTASGNRQQA